MSNKPISAGDLVQIVRNRRCGCTTYMGLVFVVKSIATSAKGGYCHLCLGDTYPVGTVRAETPWGGYSELSRLKRIPPLDELESERRDEEITT